MRQRSRELEVRRKNLELDAQSRRDSIGKYKAQQFQTRKNEEFQAISLEIHRFEKEIEHIEDNEIEIMELSERIPERDGPRGTGIESGETAVGKPAGRSEKEADHVKGAVARDARNANN